MAEPAGNTSADNAVAVYKALLRELIDQRPSGTRQRLAKALGTHKSFVSQVTNPGLPVPLPGQHIETIFRICHFSPQEQHTFLQAYRSAHPDRAATFKDLEAEHQDVIRIVVPPFRDPRKRREVEDTILEFAARLFALARNAK